MEEELKVTFYFGQMLTKSDAESGNDTSDGERPDADGDPHGERR